jgi:hypothetical protein
MPITRIGTYSQIQGTSFKLPCRVATTASITLSGTQTIDGVAVVAGDRVLVKDQGTGSANGIYIVSASTWSRAVDMSIDEDMFEGLMVYVNSGTANGDKTFYLNTANPITIGVTSLTFTAVPGGAAIGGTVTGGTTGSVLFINPTNTLAQDNANFFWDDTNNRLGIGTNSPSQELTVKGTIRSEALTASDNIFIQGVNSAGTVVAQMQEASSSGFGGLQFSGQRVDNSGGIGTYFASYVGSSGNAAAIQFNAFGGTIASPADLSTAIPMVLFGKRTGGSNVVQMGLLGSGNLLLQNGGTYTDGGQRLQVQGTTLLNGNTTFGTIGTNTGMYWDNTNNRLGIGTSSPATPLHIETNTNGSASLRIINTSTGTSGVANLLFGELAGSGKYGYIGYINSGYTASGIYRPSTTIIQHTTDNTAFTIASAGTGGFIDFATNGFALSNIRARITAAGRFLIGTTTESTYLLDVNGTGRFSDNLVVAKNQNATTTINIGNTTSGTSAGSAIVIGSDSGSSCSVGKFSATTTAIKIIAAKDAYFYNDSTSGGDIAILNNFATGTIKMAAGGSSTSQLVLKTTGQLQLNNYTSTSSFTGTAAGYLAFDSSGNILSAAAPGGSSTVTFNRQTASYTLVLADAGKMVEMNVATANNLTIPLNSSVAFAIGTQIDVTQYGAGQTTFVATSGVVIRSTNSWLKINAQYGVATLVKVGTNEWYLFGNLNA